MRAQGGLTAQDVPRLKLKWAFAYDGATSARVQPALAGGKLFAGSDNGELHALDPKTGCTYWTYRAEFGIRSALSVWPYRSGNATRYAVFFGDQKANVYAVDAVTGQLVWKRKADDHPNAAITGAIAVADGKAFVPIQGLGEETTAGRGDNKCCTFRGNLTALDVNTGAHAVEDLHGGRAEAARQERAQRHRRLRPRRRRHLVVADRRSGAALRLLRDR